MSGWGHDPSGFCPPQWTPDGRRLATVRLESGSEADCREAARLVTMDMNGAHERIAFTLRRGYFGWQTICDFSCRP